MSLPFAYRLLRSRRRTLAIEVRPGGEVLVRAPERMPLTTVEAFLKVRAAWVQAHLDKPQPPPRPEYGLEDIRRLKAAARAALPPLIARYAKALGVQPNAVRVTSARTRFGSCSAKGSLCFSWRLMDYPASAVAYVVLHEVAHLKQLNHSPAFYRILDEHMPDHRERARMLKQPPGQQDGRGGQSAAIK